MPLQQLVEYFNDRLERQHHASVRPFSLENGLVTGLFGTIRIKSTFTPLRLALKPASIVGHTAETSVTTQATQHLYSNEIDTLLANSACQPNEFESIINFDRLSRTVHMLNYLTLSHLQPLLFLDVDPRHILGIKQDHGAYFEEVILRCGLETNNVVITLTINSGYNRYHAEFIKGLNNYRQHGYRLALKVGRVGRKDQTVALIKNIAPDYVCVSAPDLDKHPYDFALKNLQYFKSMVAEIGGQSILQQIDQEASATLARVIGIDLVQGLHYEHPFGNGYLQGNHSAPLFQRVG